MSDSTVSDLKRYLRFSLGTFVVIATLAGLFVGLLAERRENQRLRSELAIYNQSPIPLEIVAEEFERQSAIGKLKFLVASAAYEVNSDRFQLELVTYVDGKNQGTRRTVYLNRYDSEEVYAGYVTRRLLSAEQERELLSGTRPHEVLIDVSMADSRANLMQEWRRPRETIRRGGILPDTLPK